MNDDPTLARTPVDTTLVAVREDGAASIDAITAGATTQVAPLPSHQGRGWGGGLSETHDPSTSPTAQLSPGTAVTESSDPHTAARLRLECAHVLLERLAERALPAPIARKVRAQWDPFADAHPSVDGAPTWRDRDAYARALEAALDAEVEALAALRTLGGVASGAGAGLEPANTLVRGHGAARAEVGDSGAARARSAVQVAMDRLFGVREDDADPDVATVRRAGVRPPRWTGLREAYVQVTGDAGVTGTVNPSLSIAREANEVTTTVMNQALLNSMTKRLVQDYDGQPQDWRRFVTIRALRDFKSQDRIRLHDFASLSTVSEGSAYTNLPWDDTRETYAPVKKGNLVVVTREAILNDDLNAIRKVPSKLAIAAAITINEFVYGLFTGNPTMSDGTKVFDDGVQTAHANRLTSSLSATALQSAMTLMMKQVNTAGKRLNLRPAYLLVPPDLLFTAMTLVSSTLVPGSMNNDANVLRGALEPLSVAQFTDATDWYVVADPRHVETVEVGFVGGRETPDLLMQEAPLEGQVFTNDQISFKVRWEFGGGWLDYRGAVWSQVAG